MNLKNFDVLLDTVRRSDSVFVFDLSQSLGKVILSKIAIFAGNY
jgi:hypothetical protein